MAGIVFSAILSIPFYYLWNALAPTYLYQIPTLYQHFPFWHCMGIFVVIGVVKALLTPNFSSGKARWQW
jgi:hypothetical protein